MFTQACMCCGWDKGPCDTHHILPKSQGGQYTLENGIILCPNCHRLAGCGLISPQELRSIRDQAVPRIPVASPFYHYDTPAPF
jgi:5-methylcytosine-specific restriction endonuclease McrA